VTRGIGERSSRFVTERRRAGTPGGCHGRMKDCLDGFFNQSPGADAIETAALQFRNHSSDDAEVDAALAYCPTWPMNSSFGCGVDPSTRTRRDARSMTKTV
jgi:hypothetical protein